MNPDDIKLWAVIPAAGVGRRMGSDVPKQYLQVLEKTILEHSLERLTGCDLIAGVVVGINDKDDYWPQLTIDHPKLFGAYTGGRERIHTVLNGLMFLQQWAGEHDWVMVHDAVRPCVSLDDIENLVKQGMQSNSGAILVSPVIDTVKQVDADHSIVQTLNRDELKLALTPQLFPIILLKKALDLCIQTGNLSTDESAAVEKLGYQPIAVTGSRSNIKVTMQEDLPLIELFIRHSHETGIKK